MQCDRASIRPHSSRQNTHSGQDCSHCQSGSYMLLEQHPRPVGGAHGPQKSCEGRKTLTCDTVRRWHCTQRVLCLYALLGLRSECRHRPCFPRCLSTRKNHGSVTGKAPDMGTCPGTRPLAECPWRKQGICSRYRRRECGSPQQRISERACSTRTWKKRLGRKSRIRQAAYRGSACQSFDRYP